MTNMMDLNLMGTEEQQRRGKELAGEIMRGEWLAQHRPNIVDENGNKVMGMSYSDRPEQPEEPNFFEQAMQGFKDSALYVKFMTGEEKIRRAKEMSETIKLPVNAILYSDDNFQKAIDIYNLRKTNEKIAGKNGLINMEEMFKAVPGLREVQQMDDTAAALAMHDLQNVRKTQGIIDAAQSMWKAGNDQMRRGELGYKLFINAQLTDDEQKELESIDERNKTIKELPKFFEDPLESIIGTTAQSAPELINNIIEGLTTGLKSGGVGLASGAVAGAAAGGVGAIPGAIIGGKIGLGLGVQTGAAFDMFEHIVGRNYLEYKNIKDATGNLVFSETQARAASTVAAIIETGIEFYALKLAGGAYEKIIGTPAMNEIRNIIAGASSETAAKEALGAYLKKVSKETAKVVGVETMEEGLQSASNDIVRNIAVDAKDNPVGVETYSAGEIAGRAVDSSLEALPGAIGFGLIPAAGGAFGIARRINPYKKEEQEHVNSVKRTRVFTATLGKIENILKTSDLNNKTPDVQNKMLTTQLKNSGMEYTYIDTEMVIKEEGGLEKLQHLAKSAGIEEEELLEAINNNGQLQIPTAKYMQAEIESGVDLKEHISAQPEDVAASRIKEVGDTIKKEREAYLKEEQESIKNLHENIINELFPIEGIERNMAVAAIEKEPENPSNGWKSAHKEQIAARNEILQPIINELNNNSEWREEFAQTFNRVPTKEELKKIAYAIATGDENAPQIMGWIAQTADERQHFIDTKKYLDKIQGNIDALEKIKPQMQQITSSEVKLSKGLSKEGYHVYRAITRQLKSMPNDKVKQAARMGALLFARHADRQAEIAHKLGKDNYTAADYVKEKIGIQFSKEESHGSYFQEESTTEEKFTTQIQDEITAEATLKKDEANFSQSVDDFMAGKIKARKSVRVMTTPLALKIAGAELLPINIDHSILKKILIDKHKNEMTPQILKQLPRSLADPIMIFRSFNSKGKALQNEYIVALDLKDTNGSTVIVPFFLNAKDKHYQVNKIKSAYGKGTPIPNHQWFGSRIKIEQNKMRKFLK